MKKKTLMVLLVVLFLVPAGLFAGIFDLSIGAIAQYNGIIGSENATWEEGMSEIDNYEFGPDIRMRILFAEVDIAALYSSTNTGHRLSGIATGGVSLDLLGLLRLGVGMGPRLSVTFDDDWSNAQAYGPNNVAISGGSDFGTAFMNAPMSYRITADLKLGKILLGLNYTIDSDGFTFEQSNFDQLMPNFDNGGNLGASVLFTLF